MSLHNPKYPGLIPVSILLACLVLTGLALLSYILQTLDAEEWDPALGDVGNTAGEWIVFWVVSAFALLMLIWIARILIKPHRR